MSGVKISNLPPILTPQLTDVFPASQAGTTYKVTMTQLQSLLNLNSVSPAQVQNQSYIFGVDTGVANAYVVTLTPAPAAIMAGQRFAVLIANSNTTASTINFNGLGANNIKLPDGSDPLANNLFAGMIADFEFDGTNFQLMNANIGSGASTGTGNVVRTASPTVTTPNIVGVSDGSNAAAGSVGQYISSSILIGSAVAVTSGVVRNITSISLTAGDWNVSATASSTNNPATVTTYFACGISQVSATDPTVGAECNWGQASGQGAGVNSSANCGPMRISLGSTTTIYLIVDTQFTVSTLSAYGFIGARRIR